MHLHTILYFSTTHCSCYYCAETTHSLSPNTLLISLFSVSTFLTKSIGLSSNCVLEFFDLPSSFTYLISDLWSLWGILLWKEKNITTLPHSAYLYINADLGKYWFGKYLKYLSHLRHQISNFSLQFRFRYNINAPFKSVILARLLQRLFVYALPRQLKWKIIIMKLKKKHSRRCSNTPIIQYTRQTNTEFYRFIFFHSLNI